MAVFPFQFLSENDVFLDHLFDTTLGGSPKTIGLYQMGAGRVEDTAFKTITQFGYKPIEDGAGGFIEQFTVAETKLSNADALKVVAISYGDRLYSVPVRVPPRGTIRKWFFRSRALQ